MRQKEDIVQLDLTGDEALEYAEFIEQKKQKFIAQHPDIFNKVREYEAQISRLLAAASKSKKSNGNGGVLPGFDEVLEYPFGGTWNQKIQFFLGVHKKLTSRQLKTYIMSIEGVKANDAAAVKRVGIGVAATLSMGVKNRVYIREKNENGDFEFMVA